MNEEKAFGKYYSFSLLILLFYNHDFYLSMIESKNLPHYFHRG